MKVKILKAYKYTKKEISKIINLKDSRGQILDIFKLYGSLILTELGTTKRIEFSSHSLPILYHTDFYWCETEEDVREQFHKSLKEAVEEKLF